MTVEERFEAEGRQRRLHREGATAARAGQWRYANPWREDRGAWEAWDEGWRSVAGDRDPGAGSRWRFGELEVEVVLCGWAVGFLGQFLGRDQTVVVYRELPGQQVKARHVLEFHRFFLPVEADDPKKEGGDGL